MTPCEHTSTQVMYPVHGSGSIRYTPDSKMMASTMQLSPQPPMIAEMDAVIPGCGETAVVAQQRQGGLDHAEILHRHGKWTSKCGPPI